VVLTKKLNAAERPRPSPSSSKAQESAPAVFWVSRDDEAQETQLPLLQFALGSLKSINGDKHGSRPVGTAKSACDDRPKRASGSSSRRNMTAIKIPLQLKDSFDAMAIILYFLEILLKANSRYG
jgi:hypothetical protein